MADYPDPKTLMNKDLDYIIDSIFWLWENLKVTLDSYQLDELKTDLRETVNRIGEMVCQCPTGPDRLKAKRRFEENIKANFKAIDAMRKAAKCLRRVDRHVIQRWWLLNRVLF